MAFYDPTMLEVHVLLVDSDVNKLLETSRLLELNSYKVTAVDDVSTASSKLSKGKTTFDVVIVGITSCNLEGYKLLHEAVNMDIIVILMSTNANATLVKCAIEDGAFLFIEKSSNVDELKYLWQHVLREKSRKSKGKSKKISIDIEEGATVNQRISVSNVDETSQKENREHKFSDPFIRSAKFCTEWTPQLHEKFMAAVRHLGEGRCFPKDILELMNVPGLTRMQVASHLQKCRYGWQPPHERQGRRLKAPKSSKKSVAHSSKIKRYGLFPRLINGSQPYMDPIRPVATSINKEYSTPPNNSYDIEEQGTLNRNFSEINVLGNMVATPNQGLQIDTTLDFLTNDDALIENNFDLQDLLDYDHIISDEKMTSGDVHHKEAEFWTSWIADFARE